MANSQPVAEPGGAAAPRAVWWLFGPPVALAGLRLWLQAQADRPDAPMALPLRPLATGEGASGDLLPWGLAAAALLLGMGVWAGRRLGWRRLAPVLAGLWVLLWLAGGAALLQRHLNVRGLQSPVRVVATVLGSRPRAPSLHAMGGTELVLQLPPMAGPHTVLIDDPRLRDLRPGSPLALQLARGRFDGLFVTGWEPPAAGR